MKELKFCDIRQDWYHSNELVPRLFRNAINRGECIRCVGFPRQWIPVFEYYGVYWRNCSDPREYMPIISELSGDQLARFSRIAKKEGTLRVLVESVSVLDPLLADFLYIVDHSVDVLRLPLARVRRNGKAIRISSWQSYGRPEVLAFEAAVDKIHSSKSTAVLLPCSRKRPYDTSRTHRKIWQALEDLGYSLGEVDQLVVTSLGVVPQQLWAHAVVLGYDSGVPDIYRVLRLARRYFLRNPYDDVVDCLQFAPYSDILQILRRERVLRHISLGPKFRGRQFYLRA